MRLPIWVSIVAFLFFSCTKYRGEFKTEIEKSDESKIRLWLEETALRIVEPSDRARLTEMEKHLDFKQIRREVISDREKVIIIPFDSLYQSTNSLNRKTDMCLLLFEAEIGKIRKGNLVSYSESGIDTEVKIPKNLFSELYKSDIKKSCSLKFLTLTGRYLYEYNFQNGKLKHFKALFRKNKPSISDDTCIDWYLQTYEDGVLISEVYVFTSCGIYVEDGSGGSQVFTGAGIQNIVNQLTNPCLIAVLNQTSNSNMNNQINVLLQTIFGVTENVNVTIKEVNNLPSDVDASHTASGTPGNTIFNSVISLNSNVLPNTSQEYIAATIYHEIIHSYLTYTGIRGELTQHQSMAENYVSQMASSLMQLFPNMEQFTATALAWQGLQGTNVWNTFAANHPQDAELYNSINQAHRQGLTGTHCN